MEILEGKSETLGKKFVITPNGIEGFSNLEYSNYTYIGLESENVNLRRQIKLLKFFCLLKKA